MYDMKYMHDKYSIHNIHNIHNIHCIYVAYVLGQFLLCVRYILNGLCIIRKMRIICIICIMLKLYITYNMFLDAKYALYVLHVSCVLHV